jgi:thiosulfate/3-mercaptopyruvate sulfurtransferase
MRGIDAAEILERLNDPRLRLVDVRGEAEFSGEQRRAARGGHIPGAVLWPWEENLRPNGTLRDSAEIRARAQAAGLLPEHELVTYCQGGVRAAHAALALRIAGYPRVRIYDGSWADWGNNPSLPVQCASVRGRLTEHSGHPPCATNTRRPRPSRRTPRYP